MRISACKLRMLALAGAALVCATVAPLGTHADDSGAPKVSAVNTPANTVAPVVAPQPTVPVLPDSSESLAFLDARDWLSEILRPDAKPVDPTLPSVVAPVSRDGAAATAPSSVA